MRRRETLGLLAAALLLFAGCTTRQPDAATPEPLPAGAVPFVYDRHLYFDALVCDTIPARLVFDTGATGLYLDSLWLANSGYKPRQMVSSVMRGGAGTDITRMRIILESLPLRIDSMRLQSGEVVPEIDLKGILGRRADGIFGQQFFDSLCVEFNLRKGYLRAVKADTLQAAGFTRCEVEKEEYRIFVPVRVNPEKGLAVEGRFLLDMGYPGTVTVGSSVARRAGLERFSGKKAPYSSVSAGIGGRGRSWLCRADSVAVGGYTLAAVPVEVSENEAGLLADRDFAGLIGNGLLERFDVVIDFASPALYLRPAAGFRSPFPYETGGIKLIDRTDICEGWIVTGLYEGIAPEGLQPGDVVVTWDGTRLKGHASADSLLRLRGRHTFTAVRGGAAAEYETEVEEIL